MISRRQFFRRLVNPLDKKKQERLSRFEILESFVRTNLLPYDFALSPEQEKEIFSSVRSMLERASDEDLFSASIRGRLEDAVTMEIQLWREESKKRLQAERLREIRESAADYVNAFLTFYATPEAMDRLKKKFETEDFHRLESELKQTIRAWIEGVDDEQLLNYDVFTVKDLVFVQLRSQC